MIKSHFVQLGVSRLLEILAAGVVLLGGIGSSVAAPLQVSLSGLDASYEVPYLIESNPQRQKLVVNTGVLVQRPAALGRTVDVAVTYRLRLTEGSDGAGPLVDEQKFSFTYAVASPYAQIHSEALAFDPPAILDGTLDHHMQIEVSHDDDPVDPGGAAVDDTDTIVDRLFHTSGVLNFGPIATTLLELLEQPGPPFIGTWPLKVADGVIDSSGIHFQARVAIGIPQAITVSRNNTSGDLSVTADRVSVQADGSAVDWGVWNDVSVNRIEMSRTGIVAGGLMIPLPDGVGWRAIDPGTLNPIFDGGAAVVALDEFLTMVGSTGNPLAAGIQFVSDCYALAFEPDAWAFGPTGLTLSNPATEFVREEIYAQWKMEKGPENPDSNDAYLYALKANAATELTLTPDGLSTTLGFDAGSYFSHFPLASNQHGPGQMVIEDSLINPAGSQLALYQSLILYGSGCRVGPDPNAIPERKRRYRLISAAATFVPGGGLHGAGILGAALPPLPGEEFPQIQNLEVGATENDLAVHEAIATTVGQLYIPGPQVIDASTDDGAMRHLLNGLLPGAGFDFERTGTAAYIHEGNGKYAGLNFAHETGLDLVSRIGGAVSPPYPASDCLRGYVRISGYTGVIEQDPSDPLTTLPVLGFDVHFDSFGFGYLANTVQTSLADGSITIPYPAELLVDFEDLKLNCCGNPSSMTMTGPSEHELPYWDLSHLDLLLDTAAFDTGLDECNTENATLRIGAIANINHLPGTHSGYLHLTPDGRLGHYSDDVENDTYFALAPHLKLAGFDFLPTRDAYPNAYDEDGNAPASGVGEGRYNLVGEGDWAFFNNGDFHAQVHGQDDPLGGTEFGPIGIKGGWKNAGKNLFNDPGFDKARRSYPPGSASLESYMDENGEYLVTADSDAWFGLLDYDVEWSPVLKMFRSPEPKGQNLLLVNLESKVRRLRENTAHLEFNAQFGGLASVGLKSLLEDSLDDAAGFLASSIAAGVEEELADGVESLSQLLNDEVAVLLQQSVVPLLDEQFFSLPVNIHTEGYTPQSVDDQFAVLPGVMSQVAAFNSGLEDALNVTERIQERLEKVRGLLGGILTITDVNNVAQFAGFVSAIAGGIDLPIPEIELDDAAIMQIAAEAQMGLNGDGDLAQFASWLAEVRAVIMEVDSVITQIQDLLEAGGEFANELQDLIALADFIGLSDDLKDDVNAYLAATVNAVGTQPGEYSPAEIDDAIRAMISDRLYAMDFTAQMHNVLKRWIEPVTDAVELAVHEALNAVAAAIIDAAAPYLQQLDDAIASFTGFGNPVKSARLRGDAVIVGDRLKKLDLLGTAVITPVEPSEIQVDALFQWCEYRSDGTSICTGAEGELNRSISLFATGAPVKAGFPLGNRVSIGAKFTIPENDPPGMSGFFELEQGGSFPAEAFRINNFSANMGFGGPQLVAYLSAFVDSSFGTWDMTGGICIGRICDLEPVSFYKGVEDIPGYSPMLVPRTGLLVYATGKYNLIDLGCLVEASVGAGAGAYFFLLDNGTREYGGRIEGNVSGKALCLIKVNGSAELAGGKTGDIYFYNGEACLKGKIGIGKLSKKFERCIGTEYNSGDGWMIDY